MRIIVSAVTAAGLLFVSQLLSADTFQEDFSSDPAVHGWRALGQTNLFFWNATNQNLDVTWDSSQTNSYFCRPLGTILAASDDFSFSFDLTLKDVAVGVNPDKPFTFELAFGLLNFKEALATNFLRGAGAGTPDLVEFDYFPDDGSGPSLDATVSDTNSTFGFYWVNLPLTPGVTYRVNVNYMANNGSVQAWVTQGGAAFASLTNSYLSPGFTDLRLDHIAVCSYSDAGQDPQYSGSLLAHGTIDNIKLTLPPPPVSNVQGGFNGGAWQVQFASQSNWIYTLERTADFQNWTSVSGTANGNGSTLMLQDPHPPGTKAFYRINAARP